MLILPELGGRIWQIVHKASGNAMFYQNKVVKPSPWGPSQQLGWLGLGGLEWNLPVVEHGYDWGTPWTVQSLKEDDGAVAVTVSTPNDGRVLAARITITLRPDTAYVEVAPRLENLSGHVLSFDYWQTAMLAPGVGNKPSAALHFVIPGSAVTMHSTGNLDMPGAEQRFTWPLYQGHDLSYLGNWDQYLGFFEYPAAHGPFVGVYDAAYDAGAVHIFPANVVHGSKVFGLGWSHALGSDIFTDDQSAYVELHSGLAPSFFQHDTLPVAGVVTWREVWYPVSGIGDLTYANDAAAVNVQRTACGLQLDLYPTRPLQGNIVILAGDREIARRPVQAGPDAPYSGLIALGKPAAGELSVQVADQAGNVLLMYRASNR